VAFTGTAATSHHLVPMEVERWKRERDASSRRRPHCADAALACLPEPLRIEVGGSLLRIVAIGASSGPPCTLLPALESSELLAPAPASFVSSRQRSAGPGCRRGSEHTDARGFAAKLTGPASAFAEPPLRLRPADHLPRRWR